MNIASIPLAVPTEPVGPRIERLEARMSTILDTADAIESRIGAIDDLQSNADERLRRMEERLKDGRFATAVPDYAMAGPDYAMMKAR